jgi:hypothetical protein
MTELHDDHEYQDDSYSLNYSDTPNANPGTTLCKKRKCVITHTCFKKKEKVFVLFTWLKP